MAVPHEVFDAILAELEGGAAIRNVLADKSIPPGTFYKMLQTDDKARERYAHARDVGLDALADETMHIADEEAPKVATQFGEHTDAGYVAWQRNRIDTRKWLLSKLKPKKYGDRMLLGGDPDNPIPPLVVIGSGKPPSGSDGGSADSSD